MPLNLPMHLGGTPSPLHHLQQRRRRHPVTHGHMRNAADAAPVAHSKRTNRLHHPMKAHHHPVYKQGTVVDIECRRYPRVIPTVPVPHSYHGSS